MGRRGIPADRVEDRVAEWGRTMPRYLVFALLFLSFQAAAAEITGRAWVVDGDTLEIAEQRIRLHGIDVPAVLQGAKRPVMALRAARSLQSRRFDRNRQDLLRAQRQEPGWIRVRRVFAGSAGSWRL